MYRLNQPFYSTKLDPVKPTRIFKENTLSKWPIGAFTSIDAGFGVHLDVVRGLNIPTIQLHAPHQASRTKQLATDFKDKLDQFGLELTAVFGGFDGESYETIEIVQQRCGLVPAETRQSRLQEMK